MVPFAVKLLVALTCIAVMYRRGEAADTCHVTTTSCIPGLPGRDGKDGQPGHDGRDGIVGPAGRDGSNGTPGKDGTPARDGSNGTPGRDGRDGLPGPPGSLTTTEQEQLKDNILEVLRDEIRMLIQCNASSPSTQSLLYNGTSTDSTNPSTAQPSYTPQPTPQPGPQCNGTSVAAPAASCKEIYECDPTAPSGHYWVNTKSGPVQVYCEMDTNNCGSVTGGWMRAAYVDMTNVSNTCPQGLTYTVESSKRMCTRSLSGGIDCSSVTFPTHGVPYTEVCGRAQGYQYYAPPAFYDYHHGGQTTLDSAYVAGLSVTYGSPRNYIWTFVAGFSKDYDYGVANCPCASPYPDGPAAPPFVGENYFCESGNSGIYESQWYLDDPLWDSQGCASGSTYCNRGGPWFTTTLSQEVIDDIEMRMCNHNTPTVHTIGVEQLEIFVY